MRKLIAILYVWIFAVLTYGGTEITLPEGVMLVPEATPQLLIYTYEVGTPKYEPVYTKVHEEESETYIWQELSKYSPNDQITAGIMGYFWKESRMKSNAVAGWDVRNHWKGQEIDICEEFTQEVDSGLKSGNTKDYFIEMVTIHYGGYGLGQWVSPDYLDDLYEFVREKGGSIGDANLQCEFIFLSLQKKERLWEELLECRTAEQCGRRIGTWYDGNDEAGSELIASAAKQYYRRFHEE